MIGFSVQKGAMKRIETELIAILAKYIEEIGLLVYNHLVETFDSDGMPYYTGRYQGSWNIQAGSPDLTSLPEAHKRDTYEPIDFKFTIPNFSHKDPFKPIFVTNNVYYANTVEYVGTPRHKQPWMVAFYTHQRAYLQLKARFS